jgi:hypothetical protein
VACRNNTSTDAYSFKVIVQSFSLAVAPPDDLVVEDSDNGNGSGHVMVRVGMLLLCLPRVLGL